MKLLSLTLLLSSVLFILITGCDHNSSGIEKIQNGLTLKTRTENITVQFYDNNLVRVTKTKLGKQKEHPSLMVLPRELPELHIITSQEEGKYLLKTEKISLLIDLESANIEFRRPDNQLYLAENGHELKPAEYSGDKGFSLRQNFILNNEEAIYGLGQHQDGYMNYRGKEVVLLQSNCNAVNPFLVSTLHYGLLWDNYSKTVFNDSSDSTFIESDMGNGIDYYFVAGNTMDEAIAGYRTLTGQAPMYGKWAFGFWQSKEHYDTQHEIDSVATRYRQLKMPIDNIIQDWDYWNGPANWSGMFFDPTLFPTPDSLISKLHAMNYKMMISIWPALGPNTAIYKEMLEKGFLFEPIGWAGFRYYDAFNPEANQLYWKYLKSGLYDKGIDAWWIDSTEPDIINALEKESHEFEMKKVGRNYLGSWARYINAFSLSMTDAIYKNMRADSNQKRVYLLTRSTFAGQQRNGATTWSGDIGASWDIYKKQIAAGINHSMSGIPYWTFDIGAFVLGSYGGTFSEKKNTPAYEELYTRMFQFGAFCPIFRSHGSDVPRETFSMNYYQEVMLEYTHLRYRLLPYIYSLSSQVTRNSYTLMRGLAMDFGNDKKAFNIEDQYMFGPSLMVCPVTDYLYHEPPKASVLVPSNCFSTLDGQVGLKAKYFRDKDFTSLSRESVDSLIDLYWYTGRPNYATDSMYSVIWKGKLTPQESGAHQFHVKTFDQYKVLVDGKELLTTFAGSEKYLETIILEKDKAYNFEVRLSNNQTGAARMLLFWKTPSMLATEGKPVTREKIQTVYLPAGTKWFDFWTGKEYEGGQEIQAQATIETMPLYVPSGSIIPMGPFLQYSGEKTADPLEIRIYPGKNASFELYEDEGDNYNYEKDIFATIEFNWDEESKILSIGKRQGEFPGMLIERTFNIVLVNKGKGGGLALTSLPTKSIQYTGEPIETQF